MTTLIELDDNVPVALLLKALAEHSLRVDGTTKGLRISRNYITVPARAPDASSEAPPEAVLVWVDALPDDTLRLDEYLPQVPMPYDDRDVPRLLRPQVG